MLISIPGPHPIASSIRPVGGKGHPWLGTLAYSCVPPGELFALFEPDSTFVHGGWAEGAVRVT